MRATDHVRLATVLLVAVAMSAGFAHLLALPNKIGLAAADYLTAQQIYRGWALLGFVVVGALVALSVLAVLVRRDRRQLGLLVAAAVCLVLSLVVFFAFTYPANRATENWTTLPDDWQALRARWEYSHAVNAGLYLVTLALVTLSIIAGAHTAEREGPAQERRRGMTTPRSSAARIASS